MLIVKVKYNMQTYNFKACFICANTGQTKTIEKQYKAKNYLDAVNGLRLYFETNRTVKQLLELERI